MEYSFRELVDISKLQELTDEMFAAFSLPCSILTTEGEILTSSGRQRIRSEFHMKNRRAAKECVESGKRLEEGEPFVVYKCPRGLTDASAPVIIAGEYLADIFAGQVFLSPPDETTERFFREQARKFGFDESEYMEAYREVPVFTEEKFRSAVSFLAKLAKFIAATGYARLKELETSRKARENEERYRLLAAHATDMISKHDHEGSFTYASPACRSLFGYGPDELIGRSACEFFHPADIQNIRPSHDKILAGPEIGTVSYRLKHKNGHFVWVETTSKTIRDPETGRIEEIIAITRDATQRKQEENQLRSANAKLNALWSIESLAEIDDDRAISAHVLDSINKMTESEYGFYGFLNDDESAMIIHSWSAGTMHDCKVKDRPKHFPVEKAGVWAEAIRSGKPLILNDYEAFHKKKRGMPEGHVPIENLLVVPFLYQSRVVSIAAAANKPADYDQEDVKQIESFLFSIHSLIESKKAERELRESEKRLKSILDYSPAIIFVKDLEGRYLLINRRFEEALGVKNEDIAGKTTHEVFPEELADQFVANDRRVIETGAAQEVEETIPGKNGDRTVLSAQFPLLDSLERPYAICGISTDITHRKKAHEEMLEMRDRLAWIRKMEALGTLAGGVAHEFNNILGIVIGNTELALEDFPQEHPAQRFLKETMSASLHGAEVVKRILRFLQKTPTAKKQVGIAPLVRETMKLMRAAIPRNIEIRQHLPCESETILASPMDIKRMVVNLCNNAAYAMKNGGGTLTVVLEKTTLDDFSSARYEGLSAGDYAKLTFEDDGVGIEEQNLDRIFEPYFTTKEIDEGLGMGLSVVYGVVKDCGGAIKVESRAGQGTTVEVLLPVVGTRAGRMEESLPEIPKGCESILFIDDEAPLVKSAKKMLERMGYRVTGKTNSIEALELFETCPDEFDLVITDMAMPMMAGDRLGKRILKIRPDLPVIMCTGHSDSIDEEKARAAGFKAFILKPLARRVLARAVRKILNEARKKN